MPGVPAKTAVKRYTKRYVAPAPLSTSVLPAGAPGAMNGVPEEPAGNRQTGRRLTLLDGFSQLLG